MVPLAVVLIVPILVAVVIASSRGAVRFVRWLALAGPVLAAWAGVERLLGGADASAGESMASAVGWLIADGRTVTVGLTGDLLASVMLAVVGVVAAMVVVFSVGYMADDPAQPRYFALLSLFTAAMSSLVMATSLPALFIAWELVGACSYLLIGFWFRRPSAARAATKAFLVTRIGDVGLLIALAVLWHATGSLDMATVLASASALEPTTVAVVALLLFVGAMGKSAQFPLHIWLPDAMEGPTPVSALIHAATMVAAGVFLLVRTWPLFEASETVRIVVLVIGTVTALGAATAALPQTDIKRVLAYSTISQLGFMFAALGAGAWVAAFFHLVTHAAFKSLLFLASGSVIHGSGTQDLREMGGLGRAMPLTTIAWVIGVSALSGIPPLAGFFSKDAVLHAVWVYSPIAGGVLFAASLITAFYSFRATHLAFTGTFRGDGHPHESGVTMTAPLLALAVLAAGLGAISTWFAESLGGHAELSIPVAVISSGIALIGAVGAWLVYGRGVEADDALAGRLGGFWTAAGAGYGVNALGMVLADAFERGAGAVSEQFDRRIVDGAVTGLAAVARRIGREFNELQSGEGQLYAALIAAGAVLLTSLALWLGR